MSTEFFFPWAVPQYRSCTRHRAQLKILFSLWTSSLFLFTPILTPPLVTPSLMGKYLWLGSHNSLWRVGREHGWSFSLVGWLSKPLHSTCPAKVTPGQPGALPLLEPAKREAGVNPEQAGKEGNVPGELLVDARWGRVTDSWLRTPDARLPGAY